MSVDGVGIAPDVATFHMRSWGIKVQVSDPGHMAGSDELSSWTTARQQTRYRVGRCHYLLA
jgi:hypothetical protein